MLFSGAQNSSVVVEPISAAMDRDCMSVSLAFGILVLDISTRSKGRQLLGLERWIAFQLKETKSASGIKSAGKISENKA